MKKHKDRGKKNGGLLRDRIVLTALALVLISLLLSFSLSYSICLRMVTDRAERMNEMFLQAAVSRTNRYLGEIAGIMNLSASSDDLEALMNREEYEAEQPFRYVEALNNYKKHLWDIVLGYDNVNNFIFLDDETYFSIHESYPSSFRNKVQEYYQMIAELPQGQDRFYLLYTSESHSSNIAVLRPVLHPADGELAGCIVLVLSNTFSSQLQLFGNEVYLFDSLGENTYREQELPENMLEQPLVFDDWKLVSPSLTDQVREEFFQSAWWMLLGSAAYFAVAAIVAVCFARWFVRPMESMGAALGALSADKRSVSAGQVPVAKRRMHFRNQLLVLYTLLVALPAAALSLSFYFSTQNIIEQRIGYYTENRTDLVLDQIELVTSRYRREAVKLAYHADTQAFLMGQGNISQLESALNRTALQKQTEEQGVMNIAIYDDAHILRYSSFYSRYFSNDANNRLVLSQLDDVPYSVYWGKAHPGDFNKSIFTVGVSIRSLPPRGGDGRKIGSLLVDYDTAELESVVVDFESQGDARVYLYDEENISVLTGDGAAAFSSDSIVFSRALENGWTALVEIPRQEYRQERSFLLLVCAAIIAVLLALSFLFSFMTSRGLSNGLDQLIRFVRRLRQIPFPERFSGRSTNEVEELGDSFNSLLDRLDELLASQVRGQVELKNSQLAAKQFELNLLQSQINPHFLYNTLKTVQYMVRVQDPRAERMVKLLIQLFRSGVSRRERLVTVEEELRHVGVYLEIQQIRFSDKYDVKIEVDEEVRQLYLLKLTFQPIVENAVYHGLELLERRGCLEITASASPEKGELLVRIRDNGEGMSEEKLKTLCEQLAGREESKSIGLLNVHERLRLFFGPEYGVSVESTHHEGTCVTLRFPYIVDPDSVEFD
ncbi:MAG: sensor histidine kinase [Oscillospiraceae bacterium]